MQQTTKTCYILAVASMLALYPPSAAPLLAKQGEVLPTRLRVEKIHCASSSPFESAVLNISGNAQNPKIDMQQTVSPIFHSASQKPSGLRYHLEWQDNNVDSRLKFARIQTPFKRFFVSLTLRTDMSGRKLHRADLSFYSLARPSSLRLSFAGRALKYTNYSSRRATLLFNDQKNPDYRCSISLLK